MEERGGEGWVEEKGEKRGMGKEYLLVSGCENLDFLILLIDL